MKGSRRRKAWQEEGGKKRMEFEKEKEKKGR